MAFNSENTGKRSARLSFDSELNETDFLAIRNGDAEAYVELPSGVGHLNVYKSDFFDINASVTIARGSTIGLQEPFEMAEVDFSYSEDVFFHASAGPGSYLIYFKKQDAVEEVKNGTMIFEIMDKGSHKITINRPSKLFRSCCFSMPTKNVINMIGEHAFNAIQRDIFGNKRLSAVHGNRDIMKAVDIIYKIDRSPYHSDLRSVYGQSKILEYLLALGSAILRDRNSRDSHHKQINCDNVVKKIMGKSGDTMPLDAVAKELNCSVRAINDAFKEKYDMTVCEYITEMKMRNAHNIIETTNIPLKHIAHNIGYTYVSNFNTAFRRRFGYPPGSLRA